MKMNAKVSSQPRKIRKRTIYNAPLHAKAKMMVAPLAPEARDKYGIRRFRVRVGDKVIIRKGVFKGTIGKITRVDIKHLRIYVENVTRKRVDGSTVHVPLRPWNVAILDLDLSDPKRKKAYERKSKIKEMEEEEFEEEEEIEEELPEEEEIENEEEGEEE